MMAAFERRLSMDAVMLCEKKFQNMIPREHVDGVVGDVESEQGAEYHGHDGHHQQWLPHAPGKAKHGAPVADLQVTDHEAPDEVWVSGELQQYGLDAPFSMKGTGTLRGPRARYSSPDSRAAHPPDVPPPRCSLFAGSRFGAVRGP